jgi:hypothetical protein
MAFNPNISISMTDCCNTISICDTTCYYDACNSTTCTDGYGIGTNIHKWDVGKTKFNITFPNGSIITGVDLSYMPNNRTWASCQITGGNSGSVSLSVVGLPTLGSADFNTDIATTVVDLVRNINAGTATHKFKAYVDGSSSDTFKIFRSEKGTTYNGAGAVFAVAGTMTTTMTALSGGTDADDCHTTTLAKIYEASGSPVLNNNAGPNFADGVWTFEYVLYDAAGTTEYGRVSKKLLFNCNAINCLKETLLAQDDCGCSEELDERILRTRLKIEQATYQFNEGLYDCANSTIIKANSLCSDVCLDC